MQLEIERKFHLNRPTAEFVSELELLGAMKAAPDEEQTDTYLSPLLNPYMAQRFPYEWLSIRVRSGQATINFKHFFPEGAEQHSYAAEREVGVADAAELLLLLTEALRCEILVVVRKRRQTFKIGAALVVVDEVAELGSFVEIEMLLPPDSSEPERQGALRTIDSLAARLKLESQLRDLRGYPFRLLDAQRRPGG